MHKEDSMTTLLEGTLAPMNAAGLPSERRMHLPPCDPLAISRHTRCPSCRLEFKESTGFMSHLIVEHWCSREAAHIWWLHAA